MRGNDVDAAVVVAVVAAGGVDAVKAIQSSPKFK
jgi:hypothetical protein